MKLPGSLRDRWNRKVEVVRRNFGRESRLSDFFSFAYEEATLINDHIFSKDAVKEYVQTPKRKHAKKKKHGSFATKRGEVLKCSLCEGNHLDDCDSLLQFDLQERSAHFITNCVMVAVLEQFLSIIKSGIARIERNAKFVRKYIEHLCMVIKQEK